MYTHIPVCSFDASYINTEVFTLLHCNHLRCRLKAELLHHGLEVVLTRTLRKAENTGWTLGEPRHRSKYP